MNLPTAPRPGFAITVLAGAALLLGGCASTWRVDNRVESFARWSEAGATAPGGATTAPAPPQTYRFERLPSQNEGDAATRQDMLEAFAREALAPLGWTSAAADAAAPWTVQVSASSRSERSPWDDPWPRFWPGISIGVGHHGARVGGHFVWGATFPYSEPAYQLRRVGIVVRERSGGRVVFETQAAHEGRWNGTPELWRAMVGAALNGFPAPPGGVRQIDIDLQR